MSSISRTQLFYSFLLSVWFSCRCNFSKLCLWLWPFVFDWSTQRVGFFVGVFVSEKLRTRPLVVMSKRGRVLFGRKKWEKKKEGESSCQSPLPLCLVKMCVWECVCAFLCAISQWVEANKARWLSYVTCWDFVFGTSLCKRRVIFCAPLLLLLFLPPPPLSNLQFIPPPLIMVHPRTAPPFPSFPPFPSLPFPSVPALPSAFLPTTPLKRGWKTRTFLVWKKKGWIKKPKNV